MFLKRRSLYSSRRIKERKRTFIRSVIVIVIVMVTSIAFFSWASHKPEITIKNIIVVGASSFVDKKIETYVEQKIRGDYLWLFSRANIFLYPRQGIKEGLLNTFPHLSKAHVSFDNFQSISVHIEERKPYYLWCGSLEDEECYFLDLDGAIFAPAPYFSGSVYFEFYGPIGGEKIRTQGIREAPLGFYFLPTQEFKRIIAFKNALGVIGILGERFFVREDGDYEFVLRNGAEILFNREQDFDVILNNLDAALGTEALENDDLTEENASLEYIDLRFNNKVFYKFK